MRATLIEPLPDEPTAVVVVGPGRGRLIGALLGQDGPVLAAPTGSYLVVRPGTSVEARAYLPGARHPQPYPVKPSDCVALPTRPPRRIEVGRSEPLLRHFSLIEGPELRTLGVAGTRVFLDVVRRGGALVYALGGQPPERAERDVLAAAADLPAALFFAVGGPASGVEAVREGLPEFGAASWFAVDAEPSYLRRALVAWAGVESLHRASINPPVLPGAEGRIAVGSSAHESDWAARLDRMCRSAARLVRQRLAIELANLHLRCVHDIVFGAGCEGLPYTLDQEMHALSLRTVAECDAAADRVLDEMLTLVLGEPPMAGVRRRVTLAVRRGFADDSDDGGELERVLLVTNTAGVAAVTGDGAVTALAAYDTDQGRAVLPPLGIGLSGACYQHWRSPANADPDRARSWLQQAIRGVELDLLKEVSRRFEMLHRSLGNVIAEAIDHGILLI
ncbi:hypothetical protein K1W54_23435 [Micromonospora sp. CPCC 205371]|nr:hypothetical protein [Micromonospora sp. CPCC 205371]